MLAPAHATLPRLRRDRARERAVQSRLMLAAERALQARLAQVIAAAGRRAAEAQRYGESIDDATRSLPDDLARALVPSLVDTARTFGARVIRSPKSAHAFPIERKAYDDLDRAISYHVTRRTGREVVAISQALRQQIRRVIRDGLAEDLGIDELARRIVEATSGEIGMSRALRIARTEVHNAAMYGQHAAARSSPVMFEKVWLATEDARTRKSHADANDQRRRLDEPFVLVGERGTVKLLYPGDFQGPPHETINCRCTVAYEPLAEFKPIAEDAGLPAQSFEPDRPMPTALPDVLDELPTDGPDIGATATASPEERLYLDRIAEIDARIQAIRAGTDADLQRHVSRLNNILIAVEWEQSLIDVERLQQMLRDAWWGSVEMPSAVAALITQQWPTGHRLLRAIRALHDGGLAAVLADMALAEREQVVRDLATARTATPGSALGFLPGPLDVRLPPAPAPIAIDVPDVAIELDTPETTLPPPAADARLDAWARDAIRDTLRDLERDEPVPADSTARTLADRIFTELLVSPPGSSTAAALTAIRERLDGAGWSRRRLREYLERQLDSDLTEEAL